MKQYTVNGWVMEFPDHWLTERDEADGHWLFYPPDSPLTVHVTPFHFEKDGALPPAEAVGEVYRAALARMSRGEAGPLDWAGPAIGGFSMEGFEGPAEENGQSLWKVGFGVYGPGELLSVNIYGETQEECREALDCFKTLKRT